MTIRPAGRFERMWVRLFGTKQWWGEPSDRHAALVIVYKNKVYVLSDAEVANERKKLGITSCR